MVLVLVLSSVPSGSNVCVTPGGRVAASTVTVYVTPAAAVRRLVNW